MPRYLLVAQHSAKPGQDAEFDAWYEHQHVPDVLACPGFNSVQRFRLDPGSKGDFDYLALYELETDDLEAAKRELRARAGTAVMPISDAIGRGSSLYYTPLGEKKDGHDA